MIKKLLLSIIFLVTLTAHAQYTLIPDPNFEQRLIDRGFDFGPIDGKVLTSRISTITFLDAGHANISDLTGIEDFVSLQYFWCDQNNLTTLDFSKNIALTNLECQINKLTSLNITKNINLEVVWCHENKLTFVDFSNNTKLQTIECDTNEMTSIDLSKNINLKTLITSRNPLNTLDVSNNINLVQIYCSSNRLRNLDISKNTKLVYFRCDTNYLTQLDASKNIALKQFSCKDNLLTSLNLKNGYNTNFDVSFFLYCSFLQNPDLRCIAVDNAAYSNANWSTIKDATSSYTDILDAPPTIISPQQFCMQENKTLNDIAIQTGVNIKWYTSLTGGSSLNGNSTLVNETKYYAAQTINGCESGRTEVLINIRETIAPSGTANQSFCIAQNADLSSISINGTAIKWYDAAINGTLLSNTVLLMDGKSYYASQTLNGCESIKRFPINVSIITELPTQNYEESVCDELNDGFQKTNLDDYLNHLITNSSSYNHTIYKSLNGAENSLTVDQITNTASYNLVSGENKFYFKINNGSCYKIAVLKLTLIDSPKITLQDIYSLCDGKSMTLQADLGFDEYLWSDGSTNSTILINKIGKYTLKATKKHVGFNCISTKEFEIKAANSAAIKNITSEELNNEINKITIITTQTGDFEYSLNGEDYQESNQFIGEFPGKQIIYVRDKNGCGSDYGYAYSIKYPKFFTPNGDSYNDTWKIQFTNNENYLKTKIFNRYGQLIKELNDSSDSWNGTFNNNELPSDDYWFTVTFSNGQQHTGHFSLKR
ncbi:T9SS type B sorting domain-containing protein [Flavobacterium sp. FlaQc-57]|uniref:T9SS type B sorting domain-containing protein n=1 Tax=Flavobacterium sp. FlaQc-57 TaxID=3374186 RepID=UPI00375758B9